MIQFSDKYPIYQQISEYIQTLILDGSIAEKEAIPSVRVLAAEFSVNPLTVSKALQELTQSGAIEKRRGLGMFVVEGAQATLRKQQRDEFLTTQWPAIRKQLKRLNLSPNDLPW